MKTATKVAPTHRAKLLTDESHARANEDIRDVPIASLQNRLQVRMKTDQVVVERYMELLMSAVHLPRPVVYALPDGSLLLADGNHTVAAHEGLKDEIVRCTVRKGTRFDAIGHAGQANGSHGLPLNNNDKRRLVTTWFEEPDGRTFTDAVIARKCGVSGRFVGLVRADLGAHADVRVKEGGQTLRTENIGRTMNGSECQTHDDHFESAPSALLDLHEHELLEREDVVALGARLKATPDDPELMIFLSDAEKLAVEVCSNKRADADFFEVRDRLSEQVRALLQDSAGNTNGQADPQPTEEGKLDATGSTAPDAFAEGLAEAARVDPALHALMKDSLDPKSILGGSAPETPLPLGIVKKYPTLVGLTTVGELAQAARGVLGRGRSGQKGRRSEGRSNSGKVNSVAVTVLIGAPPYQVQVKDVALDIGIKSIRVPRATLVKVLEESGDVVEVMAGSATLVIG